MGREAENMQVSGNDVSGNSISGNSISENNASGKSMDAADPKDLVPNQEIRADVRPWLQDFTASWVPGHIKYGPEEIRAQIQAVYDAGYEEWILWNASNRYTEGGLLPAEEAETAGTTETAQEPGNAETAAGPAAENPAD